MERKNGPWTIRSSEEKYSDEWLALRVDQVIKPDGEPGRYSTVRMRPGVAVLALDEDSTAFLARQFRYSLGRDSIEVVSGAIDEGEQPLEAAQRELREELGITAETWTEFGGMDIDTSMINCPVRLFLA